MNALARIPSPATIESVFKPPFTVVPGQYATRIFNADKQLVMLLPASDLDHLERAQIAAALITAAAESAPSFADVYRSESHPLQEA